MTRSSFNNHHSFGRTLLGLYFVLVELSDGEVQRGYGCRSIGQTTSNCGKLDPQTEFPSQIHSPELRLVVQRGDSVYFPCRVHNLGENQVLWRHGNNIIAGSNITEFHGDRQRLLSDFTLELTRVVFEDEGNYQCIVTAWPPLIISHSLKVLDPPTLNIEPDTGSVIVFEGDSVQIGCIPGGNPMPEISWSKREGTIPLHPSWFTRRRIFIENVSARESGVYICRADNRVGRPATGSIYVRVLHAPEVRTPKRRVHGGVRQRAQLHCSAHADPKPDVQWLFQQKPVPLSGRISTDVRGNDYYLNFRSVHPKDFGSYLCVANNSHGYDLRHIEFSGVPNAPVATRWETSPCRHSGAGAAVACTVDVRLFWVVECHSPLIDYRLHFRRMSMDQPVTSANEDQAPPWTELTIPADPTSDESSFLHSKSYTIYGLPNNTIFEGAIRARNKFGWSFLSAVFYFTSVPNSTLKMSEVGEAFRNSPDNDHWKNSNTSTRSFPLSPDTLPSYNGDDEEGMAANLSCIRLLLPKGSLLQKILIICAQVSLLVQTNIML